MTAHPLNNSLSNGMGLHPQMPDQLLVTRCLAGPSARMQMAVCLDHTIKTAMELLTGPLISTLDPCFQH